MRRVTEHLSLGSIYLVGEPCTFLISSAAVFMGAVVTALQTKSCLLTEIYLELSSLWSLVSSGMFHVNV